MADAPCTLRPLQADDADWLIRANIAHYRASDGFDATFDAVVGRVVTGFIDSHDPAREAAWIAVKDGERLGSVFCFRTDIPDTAQLKLLFLVEAARGQGLGQRLLDTCTGFARETGRKNLMLRTHESHEEAVGLYRKNGFRLAGREAKRSFGIDVVELFFVRPLD